MKENLTAKQTLLAFELAGVDEIISKAPVDRLTQAPKSVPAAESASMAAAAPALAPASAAVKNLTHITTLAELKKAVEEFDGCSLKKTATNTVFAVGNPQSRVMFIGEAPGAEEDRLGLPFVGASGRLLDKMLASIGLSREDNCYITNILPWRPPGNRTPNPSEVQALMPFVSKHIELMKPEIIVTLGASPLNALMGGTYAITRVRGQWFDYGGIAVLPTFHPAFLLRSPARKKEAWQDLLALQKRLGT